MKINRMKTAILLTSYILYIFLTGCGKKFPAQGQMVTGLPNSFPSVSVTTAPVQNDDTGEGTFAAGTQKVTITVTPAAAPTPTQQAAPTEDAIPTQPEKISPTAAPVITDKPSAKDPVTANPASPKPTKAPSVTIAPKPTKAPAVTQKPTNTQTVTQPPSASNEDTSDTASQEDIAAKLQLAPDISQVVIVVGKGFSDCTVSFHKKDHDGKWSQVFSTNGDCGSKGITYHKKEGDGKTPAGLYSFTMAFGIKSDPGAKLTYRKVTKYDYWIDDSMSPYYNTWINALETPGEYTSEHLIDHAPQYNYSLNINYNPENTPGLGSAIFLHGFNGLGRTTGCIAVEEKYVKTLIQEIDSSAKILIVQDSSDLANYE